MPPVPVFVLPGGRLLPPGDRLASEAVTDGPDVPYDEDEPVTEDPDRGAVRRQTDAEATKTLCLDWRAGAQHFFDRLFDGDVANNCLNWQWVAGTGTDTRPNRVLNPLRQSERYEPNGDYIRRWVPELDGLRPSDIHQPWRLGSTALCRRHYPPPIVDLDWARDRFHQSRRLGRSI